MRNCISFLAIPGWAPPAQAAGKHTAPELRYRGPLHAVSSIFEAEGFAGFFGGLQAKLFQAALNAALLLMLKDLFIKQVKDWLRQSRARGQLQRSVTQCISR